jgi:hypothetical protein
MNYCIVKCVNNEAIWTQMWCEISSFNLRNKSKVLVYYKCKATMLTLRATQDYVSRLDFISTKNEAKSHGNQALGIQQTIVFLEFVCDSVKDLVPSSRPKSFGESKVHQCVLFWCWIFFILWKGHTCLDTSLNETTKHELSPREHKRTQEQEETKIKY